MFTLLTQTTTLTPQQIENLINAKLLSNVEGINSSISNALTLIGILITVFGFVGTLSFFQRKKITDEVMVEVNKELHEDKQRIIKQANEKANEQIYQAIEKYKKNSQEEEYYRNMMFRDLSGILTSEIHVNDSNNLKEVFNLHTIRYELITKLTSGKEKETRDALKRLSRGDYAIVKLASFKKYIDILEKKTDINIHNELEELKNML